MAISLAGSLFFSLSPDASRQQVLLYLLVTMAPLAVLAPLVGPTVDRFNARPQVVALVCYMLRAVACVALAFSLYQLTFYLFAVVLLMVSKASGVVKQALVPLVTDDPTTSSSRRYARLARISGVLGGAGAASVRWCSGGSAHRGCSLSARCSSVRRRHDHPTAARPRVESVPEDVEYAETHLPTMVVASIGFMAIRVAVGFFVFTLAFTLRRNSEPTVGLRRGGRRLRLRRVPGQRDHARCCAGGSRSRPC